MANTRLVQRIGLWLLFIGTLLPTQAQQTKGQGLTQGIEQGFWQPAWKGEESLRVTRPDGASLELTLRTCEDCLPDERIPALPRREIRLPVNQQLIWNPANDRRSENADLTRYLPLVDRIQQFADEQTGLYPASPVVEAGVAHVEGQAWRIYYLYPIQLDLNAGLEYSYAQLGLQVLEAPAAERQTASAKTNAAENSVLATGEWFRIAVTQDGIYRLDRGFLNSLGINTGSIDPRNLRIHGYGGGMLPQRNSDPRPDDLPEIAIHVQGEADGSFGAGDYVLFYGQSPHRWFYQSTPNRYRFQKNLYCDTTYYYITVGSTAGKRITTAANEPTADVTITQHRQVDVLDTDRRNLIKMGRYWLGDVFDAVTTNTYNFNLPGIVEGSSVRLRARAAARAASATSMDIFAKNTRPGTLGFNAVQPSCFFCPFASMTTADLTVTPAGLDAERVSLELSYNKSGTSQAWLDYLELDYDQQTRFSFGTLFLRYPNSQDQVLGFQLENGSNAEVWDIIDPLNPIRREGSLNGTTRQVNLRSATNVTLAAFNTQGWRAPIAVGRIGNQNLHGLPPADYLLITHPEYAEPANELADIHRKLYGRTAHVVMISQIYNEFSSGRQDPTAVRDFIRHLWLKAPSAAQRPKYLMFLGDGSYDYKGIQTTRGRLPTYQARESFDPTESYASDDFFGLMDASEGFWGEGKSRFDPEDISLMTEYVDLAIGRVPARTLEEAQAYVEKVKTYVNDYNNVGNWRNRVLLVGDYKSGECYHMSDADQLDRNKLRQYAPCLEVDKIYLDNFPTVSLAQGDRFPAAREAFLKRLDEGNLIVNYTGHGSVTGLSNAEILELNDIQNLNSNGKYALWVTATCDFGKYDDPTERSGAEFLVLNPRGGAIAMVTAVREVWTPANSYFNLNVYDYLFNYDTAAGMGNTFGRANMQGKNRSWPIGNINTRCYGLLGDPGLVLGMPRRKVALTRINNMEPGAGGSPDTLKALSKVRVEGEVRDNNDQKMTGFNGLVNLVVLDKPTRLNLYKCFGNYTEQNSIVFSGQATVTAGEFTLEFFVPLDISYTVGQGTIIAYAKSNAGEAPRNWDAHGCNSDFVICCSDTTDLSGDQPPTVQLYLNDRNWRTGSVSGPEPTLLADARDDMGINTTGLGIGRELVAILDGDTRNPIVLNSFYTAKVDDYRSGTLQYRLPALTPGEHTLEVKVWDVTNNSATATTTFRVVDDATTVLEGVSAYPNPFYQDVRFRVSHNQLGQAVKLNLRIRDFAGRTVFQKYDSWTSEGYVYTNLTWSGRDASGNPLPNGVYLYELELEAPNGKPARYNGKLVLARPE